VNQKLVSPHSPARQFGVLLSPTRRGARLARLPATQQLRTRGLPLAPAALVVAELANNAATHGRVPGRNSRLLLQAVGGTLRIEVTDTRDDPVPELRDAGPTEEAGRGMTLVAALADRWGVVQGPTPRKTVWAELALSERKSPDPESSVAGPPRAPQEPPTGEKAPDQAPPLPPAGRTHSRE
jgi:anti-sigma regulatory factor (Ser/Thr protein kinase)